uniref:Maestro heat like repeat family member 8 n=1 Tax=Ursus americanus TaxID=9643 RepID=A0A452SV13_URSAM
ALLGKIRAMSVLQKNVVLDTIHHSWEGAQDELPNLIHPSPSGGLPHPLLPAQHLLRPSSSQTFLFHIYGLILKECASEELVRRHVADLLELSHQSASQREGIAAAIGIVSSSHLQAVWTVLEHLGRTRFLRTAFMSPDCQDNILKTSFLSAAVRLTKALKQENRSQSYKFTQIPELIQCLLCVLQKEPNFLATLHRQKIILVIVGLSKLRPSLQPMVKSQILQTCLWSLFTLPPLEKLKSCLPPLDPAPDVMVTALYKHSMEALDLLLRSFISENKSMDEMCFLLQHTEPWLQSDKSHERKRVAQTIFLLLKYVADYVTLTEEATPSVLGHHLGLLALLWRDKDPVTRSHSRQCIYLLLQLLTQQRGDTEQFMHLNKMKTFEAKARRESEMKFYNVVKVGLSDLTVAQRTQLILALLEGLCSHSHPKCDLASQLLLMMFEDRSIKAEQVAEVLQGLFQELPSIAFQSVLQTAMKVVTVLGTQYTQETVEVILSLCHPSDRQVLPLWKALAGNTRLARKVLTLLYGKLKLRPSKELIRLSQQAELISLLALGTIYELLYTREYKPTVRWAFAGILMGLLTQLHYLFELDAVEGISDYQEDILEIKPLGPCRTCLEALKGLFWTTNYWEVFAYLKLRRVTLLASIPHGTSGPRVCLSSDRAMVHYDCELKAVLGQAVISLKSPEERDNIVAILIITEFLNSRELTQYVSRRAVDNFLSLGLSNPNQLVRAVSLKGLSSILMHPKKVVLLRNRLAGLLDGFVKPEPKDLMGLMEILGDILHRLGTQGIGPASLKMAQHLLPLFEDEQAPVRGGAIFLFGDVIYSGGKKYRQVLKSFAFQALVPLLFHLVDSCPKVVMVSALLTFLRCAILLKWEFRKELFGKLAWGHGLGAENDIFIYMVESNFGNYHQFLMQALMYLASPHKNLKHTAMKFIGRCRLALLCLRVNVEVLKQDPDSVSRRFYQSFLEDISELSHFVTR